MLKLGCIDGWYDGAVLSKICCIDGCELRLGYINDISVCDGCTALKLGCIDCCDDGTAALKLGCIDGCDDDIAMKLGCINGCDDGTAALKLILR